LIVNNSLINKQWLKPFVTRDLTTYVKLIEIDRHYYAVLYPILCSFI